MYALPVDYGVRTREIDILEDTGGKFLSLTEHIRFYAIVIDDDHFARLDIAHELRVIDIESARL